MPKNQRNACSSRDGLSRLALELSVQLPKDPEDAEYVIRKMRQIHGILSNEATEECGGKVVKLQTN